MAYTNQTRVSNFLGRALTTYEADGLALVLSAVKQYLDKRLGSTFDVVAPSVRTYDGGVRNLDIDPCINITKVEDIGDDGSSSYEYTNLTEYVAEPQNETVKRELRKRGGAFPRGARRIAVSATFSEYDGEVPGDIVLAATRLAAGVMRGGAAVGQDNVKRESLEGHSIEYDTTQGSLEGLASSDPTVSAILASREDLLIDNVDTRRELDEEDGGIYV